MGLYGVLELALRGWLAGGVVEVMWKKASDARRVPSPRPPPSVQWSHARFNGAVSPTNIIIDIRLQHHELDLPIRTFIKECWGQRVLP